MERWRRTLRRPATPVPWCLPTAEECLRDRPTPMLPRKISAPEGLEENNVKDRKYQDRKYGSFFTAGLTAAVAIGALLFVPLKPLAGQDAGKDAAKAGGKGGAKGAAKGGGYQPPEGPAPRKADGKIDFSGYWQRPYTPDMSAGATDMNGKPFPNEDRAARGVAAPPPDPAAAVGRGGGGRGGGPRLLP